MLVCVMYMRYIGMIGFSVEGRSYDWWRGAHSALNERVLAGVLKPITVFKGRINHSSIHLGLSKSSNEVI